MKHIKMLGLMAVAALALTAVIGTATASASEFTATKGGVKLKTKVINKHVFTVTGSNVECAKITFAGTTPGVTSETQTVTPTYEECTAFGFAGATVNTAGCSYTFHSGIFNSSGTDKTANIKLDGAGKHIKESGHAEVDLSGCTNGGITLFVNVPFIAKCHVLVPNQNGISGINYKTVTEGGVSDIVVEATSEDIHATILDSTGSCPLTKSGTHTNAKYVGSATVQAEEGSISYDDSLT